MNPAVDPNIDHKALVREGYNRCARAYADARAKEPADELNLLLARVASPAAVLDLGCGSGIPVARTLAERFSVTGVDFSAEQIRLARKHVPAATFIECDLSQLDLPAASFHAVVAFYVLFHLPRHEQLGLLASIWKWLKPGGCFLGTLSRWDEEPYTEPDFFGVEMFWTNFGLERYQQILRNHGFELLHVTTTGHGYDDLRSPEQHPLVFARKPPHNPPMQRTGTAGMMSVARERL
jgi:SAM-dependent methyltransferase